MSSNTVDRDDVKWYVIHTNTSCENKVKANLEHRVQVMRMQDQIFEVLVPAEAEVETAGGGTAKKAKAVQKGLKKIYPGYVLVRMSLNDDSWAVVRNTPGVTG